MMLGLCWPLGVTAALSLADHDPGGPQDLVLELTLDGHVLDDAMLAVEDEGVLYLPLGHVARLLELGLEVDATAGRVDGWLASEEQRFRFDADDGSGQRGDEPFSLEPDEYKREAEDLYIAAPALNELIPSRFAGFDRHEQRVELEATDELPLLARLERQARWSELRDDPAAAPRQPLETLPYQPWARPAWAVGLEQRYYSRDDWPVRLDGELRMAGDFLYHEGQLYATTTDDELDRLDVTLARDYENRLVSRYEVGRVAIPAAPILSRYRSGRGLRVTNAPPGAVRTTGLADHTLEGDAPDGWSAELYLNGELVDYIESVEGGRYRFDEVPVRPGENRYDIMLYGPRGQVRTEQETLHAGPGMLPPGEIRYDVSHIEPGRSLIGDVGTAAGAQDSQRSRMRMDAGLLPRLSSGLEIHQSRDPVDHPEQAVAVDLTGSIALTWLHLRRVEADDRGAATGLALQRPLGSWNLRLEHQDVEDLDTEELGSDRTQRSEMVLSGPVSNWFRWRSDYRLEEMRDGAREHRARLNQTTRIDHFRLSHRYERSWGDDLETRSTGTLNASRPGRRDRLSLGLQYRHEPDSRLDLLRGSWNRHFNDRLDMRGELRASLSDAYRHGLRVGLNQRWRRFRLGGTIGLEEDGEWSLMVGFETGAIPEPHKGGWRFSDSGRRYIGDGVAAVRVMRREEDERIPEEGVVVRGDNRRVETRADGVAVVEGLTAYERHDIALELDGIENPFIRRVGEDVSVSARPGAVQAIEYELAHTGEIEGTVQRRSDDEWVPVPGVRIQALDAEGEVVASTATAFDGLYILDRLLPGDYVVRVHPGEAERLGVSAEETRREVELEWGEEIVHDVDIRI